ncbi:sensor histidine kinase [Pseudodesulfovibrio tunisiensis]|uniref:sensor histidine kinase n=1 Tax=Pseudodesulfovibrio tunisiensis TaxID=463192 RepID=UPI001FB5114C|nr:ATP-binding protein [Pseudodesulfovibrio tunisiensis]
MTDFAYDSLGTCYWDGNETGFNIGIVGNRSGFDAILDVIFNNAFHEFFPDMRLVALSELNFPLRPHQNVTVPVYRSWQAMLDKHHDINLVVELTGSQRKLTNIRRNLPDDVSLMDHREVVFFCGLHDMALVKGHFRDDSERQRVLLKSIIDEIREDIFLLDKSGNVVDLNRPVWQRAGLRRKDLLGHQCWEAARLPDGSAFCDCLVPSCPFYRTLASETKDEAMMTRVDRNGQLRYYRIYSYPLFDIRGHMTHVMIMHRDITDRTYREKHQQKRERLAVVGEMSTYLAHEIRNPLFAIGGFANSLFKSKTISDKDREKAAILVEETKRLDTMLTSMLKFVRPTASADEASDLCAVLKDTIELMSIGYAGQGYEFEVHCSQEMPKVAGSAETIKQCLVNLIKNALEAMPSGGIVEVTAELRGDSVALAVHDTGTGMSEKEMDRAFSPFFSTKNGGSGLGLAMIKKIVEELGGSVRLESRQGQGTTVTLLLPPAMASVVRNVN